MRGGLLFALMIVLALNTIFFLSQTAVTDINPGGTQFFNYGGSMIGNYDQSNYTLPTNPTISVPSTVPSVSPTTGNIFTDAWSASTNWLLDVTEGQYLIDFILAVPNFLKAIGLPAEFTYAVGFMWYLFALTVVILFIRGIVQ